MKDLTHIFEMEQLENPPKLVLAAHIQHCNSLFWIVYSSVAQAWPLMVHTQCLSGIIQIVHNHNSYFDAHISPLVCHFNSWYGLLSSLSFLQMASNSIFHRRFKRKHTKELCHFWQKRADLTFGEKIKSHFCL